MLIRGEFDGVKELFQSRGLATEIDAMLEELHQGWLGGMKGTRFQKQVLCKYGWDCEQRIGIEKRLYAYDGLKQRIAIEIEWTQSERVLADMLKLQFGLIEGRIDAGVIVSQASNAPRSPIPRNQCGGIKEIQAMRSIITIPIYVAVFAHQGAEK